MKRKFIDIKKIFKVFSGSSAMTIVEMLCTIAILALILYPIYEFLRQGALSWETGENKTEVIQNARIGLDKMCDEIKHAKEIFSFSDKSIRFWFQDINDDKIADNTEIISYSWDGVSGNDLERKLDSEAAPTPLANYVDNFQLKYYDKNGAQTLSADNIVLISAELSIKKSGKDTEYISTMRKSAHPRNM